MNRLIFLYCFLFFVSGSIQAALVDRGGGMIYDDHLNVTWLKDANYAKTSGYDEDGKMNWGDALAWASQLSFEGYDDWRLSNFDYLGMYTGVGGCGYWGRACGFNVDVRTSDLAYMYYVNLGNVAFFDINGNLIPEESWGVVNSSYFINIMEDEGYWINHSEGWGSCGCAWSFNMYAGSQSAREIESLRYAWAMRDGDVNFVPVPATMVLLSTALACVFLTGGRLLSRRTTVL